ncbi:MAG: tripartite tricarboxylate transporter permease [Spirochaetaceae bacterium]|nr:tripartite tricarboxylate transporter permease [Spirochaetaceae bacterium]
MDFATIMGQVFASLTPQLILVIGAGVFIGLVVGALPGLTTTMGIALLTGITFKFGGNLAVALLLGLYVGGVSGGCLSAILLGIPGTPASAATSLDGFPLASQGKGAQAIYLARTASVIGTFIGIFALALFTPILTKLSLQFTSVEFFVLGLFGVLISGTMSGQDIPVKGWMAGIFGLCVGMIGTDELTAYNRFTFGSPELLGGVPFIPIMIGFFGIPQVVDALSSDQETIVAKLDHSRLKLRELTTRLGNVVRSGLIGVGIGIIPGVGEDVAAWTAYGVAKKSSKRPEEFGKGSYDGIIASETANNACIGGALVPLLSLGIPGSPPAAVLLGALLIHGVRPGPMLQFESPAFMAQNIAWLLVATLFMWVFSIFIAKPMQKILQVKNAILMPIVAVLCAVGAFTLDLRFLDIILVFVAGIVGLAFSKGKYPPAPLVLGIILGPFVDTNFRRGMLANDGNPMVFLTRPISLVLVLATVALILAQLGVFRGLRSLFAKKAAATP